MNWLLIDISIAFSFYTALLLSFWSEIYQALLNKR